jgi:heptosyltransferase-2
VKILIIKLGAIGDVVRTTSFLEGLKGKYPGCQIDWVTSKGSADMLKGNGMIDNVFLVGENVVDGEYDLVISLDDEDEALRIATDVKKEKLVGGYFDGDGEKKYTDDSAKWFDMGLTSRFGKERADEMKKENGRTYQLIIAEMLGIEVKDMVLNLSDDETRFGKGFSERKGFGGVGGDDCARESHGLVIGLNTGAGKRWPLKKLDVSKTISLADRLVEEMGAKVMLFGGPEEEERNSRILEGVKLDVRDSVIDAGCNNSLREFSALVNLCDVVVVSDSLAMHIAIALKKKVVVFFGPTSAAEIELYGRGKKVVARNECACCYRKECDVSPSCMDDITVDELFEGVRGVIGS